MTMGVELQFRDFSKEEKQLISMVNELKERGDPYGDALDEMAQRLIGASAIPAAYFVPTETAASRPFVPERYEYLNFNGHSPMRMFARRVGQSD